MHLMVQSLETNQAASQSFYLTATGLWCYSFLMNYFQTVQILKETASTVVYVCSTPEVPSFMRVDAVSGVA